MERERAEAIARRFVHATAAERHNDIGGTVGLYTDWMDPNGQENFELLVDAIMGAQPFRDDGATTPEGSE